MTGDFVVWVRGGGDLGTGVAHRLHRAGFSVVITEIDPPLVIRRTVAFANAVFERIWEVEGVTAELATTPARAAKLLHSSLVPVLIDPSGESVLQLDPGAVIDARMLKRHVEARTCGPGIAIGLGPGFVAGKDVDAVIETQRGHYLGQVILSGSAAPDSGMPGAIGGHGAERVLHSPCDGALKGSSEIGDHVEAGQVIATVSGCPIIAGISGVLRGLLHDGQWTSSGSKVGDIDPRGVREYCFTISDKARAIGGGALEALLFVLHSRGMHSVAPGESGQAWQSAAS